MNVLLVDDCVPHLDSGAGYPRANALVNALAALCGDLALYPLVFPSEPPEGVFRDIDTRVRVLADRGKAGLGATLREYADRGCDVLWVSRPDNMRDVAAALDAQPGLRERFYIVYDAEALYAPRTMRHRELMGAPLGADAAAQLLARELELAARADLLVSVSAYEARIFRERTDRPCEILGFTTTPEPSRTPFAMRGAFGFVGAVGPQSPNEDSLLWYAANVMHRVYERTAAPLQVAGRATSPFVQFYAGPELHPVGQIAELAPFFEGIRVFVAPTRFAAGLPQKLIDAASYGVPIVATSVLARQLGWSHERELLVADDADNFVAACIALYTDGVLWQGLRERALPAVRALFGPEPFAAELRSIVAAIERGAGSVALK